MKGTVSVPNLASAPQLIRLLGRVDERYGDPDRNEYDRDYDRIVFSSDFRRLKDTTQVFPLSSNDFTRTRLTHSLEIACVGRTLGRKLAVFLKKQKNLPTLPNEMYVDVGTIVSAACLAHDIGNPPFGHSGEHAIQAWALKNVSLNKPRTLHIDTPEQEADLHEFEGNVR